MTSFFSMLFYHAYLAVSLSASFILRKISIGDLSLYRKTEPLSLPFISSLLTEPDLFLLYMKNNLEWLHPINLLLNRLLCMVKRNIALICINKISVRLLRAFTSNKANIQNLGWIKQLNSVYRSKHKNAYVWMPTVARRLATNTCTLLIKPWNW